MSSLLKKSISVMAVITSLFCTLTCVKGEENLNTFVNISNTNREGKSVLFQYVGDTFSSKYNEDRSISAEDIENSGFYDKQEGTLTLDGVDFNIGTKLNTDELYFRTDHNKSNDFTVPCEYYKEINILGAGVVADASFIVTLTYEDDTTSGETVILEHIGSSANAAIRGLECYSNSGVVANRGWKLTLHSFKIEPDLLKKVKSIKIPTTSGGGKTAYILAMTAVGYKDEEFVGAIEEEIDSVIKKAETQDELVYVEKLIEEAEDKGIDISLINNLDKYREFKKGLAQNAIKIEKTNTYSDLTKVGNRQIFLYNGDDSFGGVLQGTQALSADDLETRDFYDKERGIITVNDTEYYIGTDLDAPIGIHTGVTGFTEKTVPIREGYYSGVNILACGAGVTCTNASVKINYADGTFAEMVIPTVSSYSNAARAFSLEVLSSNGKNYPNAGGLLEYSLINEYPEKKVTGITFNSAESGSVIYAAATCIGLDAKNTIALAEKLIGELNEESSVEHILEISYFVDILKDAGYDVRDLNGYDEYIEAKEKFPYIKSVDISGNLETIDIVFNFNNSIFASEDMITVTDGEGEVNASKLITDNALKLQIKNDLAYDKTYNIVLSKNISSEGMMMGQDYVYSIAPEMLFGFNDLKTEKTNNTVKLSGEIINVSLENSQTYFAMIALKDEEGGMLDVVTLSGVLSKGKGRKFSNSLEIPGDYNGQTHIELYLWDSLLNLNRIYKPVKMNY